MKKKLCLFLALIIALSLTACGGNEDVSGQLTPNENVSATVPGGIVGQPESTEPATSAPETAPAVPETSAPEENLSLGRMEGGVYTNLYTGFACTLDSNWTFLSAGELQQIPDSVSDAISGSELAAALEGTQQFMDMQAENVNDLTSMNVLYQKLSMQERLIYAAMSEEQVLESILSQMDLLTEGYAQAGIHVISMKIVTVNFLGQERFALHTEATIQDIPYYILQLYDVNLGAYSVTTTLASFVEDQTASLLDLFYVPEQ